MEDESSSQNFRKSTEARPELSTNAGSRHNQEHGVKYEKKPVAKDSGLPASWLAYSCKRKKPSHKEPSSTFTPIDIADWSTNSQDC